MEDTGVETFFVEMILNGNKKSFEFPISTTNDFVKNEMRSTYNVTGGTLSSRNDRPSFINRFVAGGVYYFIECIPLPVQALFQNRDNFVGLLENALRAANPQWKANEKIVDKIIRLYAARVMLCATPEQSLSLYQEVKSLPQTTTINLLNQSCDIQLNGVFFFNTKSTLIDALHNGTPAIFKVGRSMAEAKREYVSLQAVLQYHQSTARSLFLVNIELIEITQMQYQVSERYGEEIDRLVVRFGLIMPKYALVLSQFQLLKTEHVVKWLNQIKTALTKLHEAAYAHNDVKPENIFVDQNGDAFLGDYGGLAKIGEQMHEFSQLFQASDTDYTSSVENDFYSLALSALAMTNVYYPNMQRLSKAQIKIEIMRFSVMDQIFGDVLI